MLLTLGKGIILKPGEEMLLLTDFITTSLTENQVKSQANLQNDIAKITTLEDSMNTKHDY